MNYDFSDLPLAKVRPQYEDRKFPLHSLTVLSGHSREIDKEYYNDGRQRNVSYHTVWQYTISGLGRLDKNGGSKDLIPGALMLLTVPGDGVYYLPEQSKHWEFVFLTMAGRESYRAVKTAESRCGNILPEEDIPKTMERFHKFIHTLFADKITTPFNNSSQSYALCMSLLEEVEKHGIWGGNSIEDLLVLLHDNFSRDISVEEMASVMRLSRSHFTRVFCKNVGMSPREYLEDLRLKNAVSLLQTKILSVKEVAAQVGIRDVNYFCRVFKNRYGISPGKFQNRNYWQR